METISVCDAVGRKRLLYRVSKERWLLLETLIFVPFLPQDNVYLESVEETVTKLDSETACDWNRRQCQQLMSYSLDWFWCHLLYNQSLQRFLSDYCRFRLPYYDSPQAGYCWLDKLVYDIFYRASSPHDCLSDAVVDVSTVFYPFWDGQVSQLVNLSLIWDWFGIFPGVVRHLVSRLVHFYPIHIQKEWWYGPCLEAWSVACDAVESNPSYVLHILDALRGIYCYMLQDWIRYCLMNNKEERDEAMDILLSMIDHLWQRIWNTIPTFPCITKSS
ncbi:uncharacterized protein Gasu_44630 [Galdieria sulphuraria]|uniref:Uncharacterized protein n=1 Tax=Galdieria sulphuraria TaxID=130081 RepID=M2XDC2_GALSU|nr:uncharacterized protein Gasu_44630 [Galdieria sulphuraria]EME27957.1 hypothetical protein Gasu_44630 [Galdieria sulphuraria]|eukprot:XP_005704477.1 hypothetical protein Gasu_44630 [Galdieria sulphuraria]